MKLRLKNNYGVIKEVKAGFSWTVFFFSWLVPLIRGDFKWSAIMFATAFILGYVGHPVLAGFAGLAYSFFYNKLYIKDLMAKGFAALDAGDAEILNKYMA